MVPGEDFEPGGEAPSLRDVALERLRGSQAALSYMTVSVLVWSIFGILTPMLAQVFIDRLLSGQARDWFGGSGTPLPVTSITDERLQAVQRDSGTDEWLCPFGVSVDLPEGTYPAEVVLETYRPYQLSFSRSEEDVPTTE